MSSAPPTARRRVLFVDDEPQFLEMTRELMSALSGGQWEIATANSASAAFAVLQSQPVDLAVIDLQMGVMDGIQMLSLLTRGYPNVQKVALTGFANENYRAACLASGAELFLEKPTSTEGWRSLYAALHELIRFKPEEGFRGVLRRVGLADVIQMECLARSSSILEISDARTQGRIFVADGQLVHAEVGGLTGEAAFNHLMALSGGQFNLKPFAEPPARTLTGQWEFLLMEAARKRDEAAEATQATGAAPAQTPPSAAALAEIATAVSPTPSAATPPSAAWTWRPQVTELLICSAQGDIVHQWECRHPDLWINFFEFLSQRSRRLAGALPLGEFDRLEISSGDGRVVVIIGVDRGVMVKTRKESLPV